MIENPNSSGQGFDADHKSNPFHEVLTNLGWKYSHSTPVHYPSGVRTHHTYKFPSIDHNIGVHQDQQGTWVWSGSKGGSGVERRGRTKEDLVKYADGVERRAFRSRSSVESLLTCESLRDLYLEGSEYMAYLYKSGNAWHIETMDGRHTENFLDHEAPGFFKNIDLRTRYAPDPKALVQAFAHKNVDSIIVRVDQEKLEPYLSEKDRTAFAGEGRAEDIDRELGEIDTGIKALKARSMIYQASDKEAVAKYLDKPSDAFYDLPFDEWMTIRRKYGKEAGI